MHSVKKLDYGGKIFAQSEQLKKAVDRMRDAPPDWYSVLLIELATECLSNSMELFRGIEEMSASRCAWGARNLLELSYFTRYVAQSAENARRFHEDAMCDLKDMLKKLETLGLLEVRDLVRPHPSRVVQQRALTVAVHVIELVDLDLVVEIAAQ